MSNFQSVELNEAVGKEIPSLAEEAKKYDHLEASTEDRPEWLPEKFKSAEELSKAYSELERKLSSKQNVEEQADEESDESTNETDAPPDDVEQQARETVESKGIDFDGLSTSYWETGNLTDTQYETLEKSGIPKELVDQFIAGQEAVIEATKNKVFSEVGGEQKYNTMTEWAANNYSKEEVEVYNKAVNGTDRTAALLAVKGLKGRFEASVGFEPTHRVTGTAVKGGSTVYKSLAELEVDMGDPRYRKDPAFRRNVEQKLSRSDIM